ncbi:helix-turn-helix domain-containing protein [Roseomonas sp. GC11]|uniref:helix-turn-helix domain-containing protein n=1 Tax=Roseomonas sp. GC11 TaxID=2950546 RepID=UPI00210A437C|nr:helix-turn-helix domain-containing protein [Roseomonas sp. GC11]MCQ4161621.1 helix-turn-helix domain-containing protein [Roseomonas sp. GC11]
MGLSAVPLPDPAPACDLYGEPAPRPRPGPVHVEPLMVRSARHAWTIRPHRHRDLHQFFWLRQGGGVLVEPQGEQPIQAPALLSIPPEAVHGFRYQPGSDGVVVTLAGEFLAACCHLAGQGAPPPRIGCHTLPAPRAAEVEAAFTRLAGAFPAARPAALAGNLLLLLAELELDTPGRVQEQGGEAALFRRFRAAVEQHYRSPLPLAAYAGQLGISVGTLTRLCRAHAGQAPLALIQERRMAEARQMLRLSRQPVSAIAYALGFEPAYFSRFFTRHEGVSPAAYRRAAERAEDQ